MPFLFRWLAINADKSRIDASIAKKMLSLLPSFYFTFCIAHYVALSNRI